MKNQDLYSWRRWWLPEGDEPQLDSFGMLNDPAGIHGSRVNASARTLDQLSEFGLLILLGEPGMGKSIEVTREFTRLTCEGSDAILVDLGEFSEWSDIKTEIFGCEEFRTWVEDESTTLVLTLEAFDEATLLIPRLGDSLVREFRQLDHSRLKLRVVSRSLIWPDRLQELLADLWPGPSGVYSLAPLTTGDVELASEFHLGDAADEFVANVRTRGLGNLAARPITLELLIDLHSPGGDLPSERREIYSQGVTKLACEHDPRRQEPSYEGPTQRQLLDAASHLAVISMCSGSPRIAKRPAGGAPPGVVVLEDILTERVTHECLRSVWESALMVRDNADHARWAHRSFAEFLAAELLAGLPWPTARHLLADSSGGKVVAPQLIGVAQWLAYSSRDALEWLASTAPDSLLTSDLVGRPAADRSLIAEALVAAVLRGEAPTGRRDYRHLGHEDLAEELGPLLSKEEPSWVIREGILMVAHNRLRDFDDFLIETIEQSAVEQSPTTYDEMVQVASFAVAGLDGCQEPQVRTRLWNVAGDEMAPIALRAAVLRELATTASPEELLDRVTLTPMVAHSHRTTQPIGDVLSKSIENGSGHASEVIRWLSSCPEDVADSEALVNLAIVAVRAALENSANLSASAWAQIVLLVQGTATGGNISVWQRHEPSAFQEAASRRDLTRDLLSGDDSSVAAWQLRSAGLLDDSDFEYWLGECAKARQCGRDSSVAEEAAQILARPDIDTMATARRVASEKPEISDLVDNWFSDERIKLHSEALALETEVTQRPPLDTEELFAIERVQDAADNSDWPAVVAEFRRPTKDDAAASRLPAWECSPSESAAWAQLDQPLADSVEALASEFLQGPPAVAVQPGSANAAACGFALLAHAGAERQWDLSSECLQRWLPALINLPTWSGVTAKVVERVAVLADDDRRWLDNLLTNRIDDLPEHHDPSIVHHMGDYSSEPVMQALVRQVSRNDIAPHLLGPLLSAALERSPEQAAQRAIDLISNRPDGHPASNAEGQVLDLDHPGHLAWGQAVSAANALSYSAKVSDHFAELLHQFKISSDFAHDVLRSSSPNREQFQRFRTLSPGQTASLYLWAVEVLPPKAWLAPGVPTSLDPLAEFPDELLRRLGENPGTEEVEAMQRIADVLEEGAQPNAVWVRARARDARAVSCEASWAPMCPSDVAEILQNDSLRSIGSASQLADVIAAGIESIAIRIAHDAVVRGTFWHRQHLEPGTTVSSYIPCTELEFSDRFALLLDAHLRNVVVRREVQLQPKLGAPPGQFPDLEAIVQLEDGTELCCLIEIKCNWHRELVTAISDQLVDRYLDGPRGTTGIYLVAWYRGDDWKEADSRRQKAEKLSLGEVQAGVQVKVADAIKKGLNVRALFVDLSLAGANAAQ